MPSLATDDEPDSQTAPEATRMIEAAERLTDTDYKCAQPDKSRKGHAACFEPREDTTHSSSSRSNAVSDGETGQWKSSDMSDGCNVPSRLGFAIVSKSLMRCFPHIAEGHLGYLPPERSASSVGTVPDM